MLANYHTHTTFCDGQNSVEENVISAIEQGLSAIGISSHAHIPFSTWSMKETDKYIEEVKRVKEKYKNKIQVYLGTEEDCVLEVNRNDYDYIIGSCHYVVKNGKYYPIDHSPETLEKCVEVFDNDPLAFSNSYYERVVSYLSRRKPDLIGHFDLITKFDEKYNDYFLKNQKYWEIAEKYTLEALKSQSIFEVNTGMITRGYRTTPCPHDRLLYLIKKNGGNVCISADAHKVENLCGKFIETKKLLKDIGFTFTYVLFDNEWKKDYL